MILKKIVDINGIVVQEDDWVKLLIDNRTSYIGPFRVYKSDEYWAIDMTFGYMPLQSAIFAGKEIEIVENSPLKKNKRFEWIIP